MSLSAIRAWALAVLLLVPFSALAQAPSPAPAAPADQLLKPEQLEALVAPIALYPDPLLAQVLAASTYPLEIVQAERWVNEHKNLSGDPLKTEVDKQSWEESVKALAATPSVLKMMSDKLDWTKKLGDAFLAQPQDVTDAVQRLRQRAYDNKKLPSTKEQKVTVVQVPADQAPARAGAPSQTIAIEPASPETIAVPAYDPAVVYGSWPYPAYPPYGFYAPGYYGAGLLATGVAFGAGYALGRWATGGYWGGRVNWGAGNINIGNRVTHWQHSSVHRQGVRYSNTSVQQRFGNNNIRQGAQGRIDARGRPSQLPATRPTGNRPTAGQGRPGGAQVANRQQGQRASQGQRQSSTAGRSPKSNAFSDVRSGTKARQHSQRGRSSMASAGANRARVASRPVARPAARPSMGARGGGFHGGGMRGGGFRGGGGGMRGGGRRSDIRIKHDIVLLGYLENGLGFYRFAYNNSGKVYVGVMAQEVETVMPGAVRRGSDGYLRVFYEKLGLRLQTYDGWLASGARIPAAMATAH